MGGVGGQIPPPLLKNRNLSITLELIDLDLQFFYICTHVSYIIIPIKYENPILKSLGFIRVLLLPPIVLDMPVTKCDIALFLKN